MYITITIRLIYLRINMIVNIKSTGPTTTVLDSLSEIGQKPYKIVCVPAGQNSMLLRLSF